VRRTCVLIVAAILAAPAGVAAVAATGDPVPHFADADNAKLVERGGEVYRQYCASCHGRRLQGQALWQLMDKFAGRRAPAHDATGHTWQHSDEDLFHMTKYGRFAAAPPAMKSYMPAFEASLSDADIVAVLAYIKANWPIGLRASQATLNPGLAGMPRDADKVDWTLPPICTASFQRWRSLSAFKGYAPRSPDSK
jgi:mono/diheme cytochrome c family protein